MRADEGRWAGAGRTVGGWRLYGPRQVWCHTRRLFAQRHRACAGGGHGCAVVRRSAESAQAAQAAQATRRPTALSRTARPSGHGVGALARRARRARGREGGVRAGEHGVARARARVSAPAARRGRAAAAVDARARTRVGSATRVGATPGGAVRGGRRRARRAARRAPAAHPPAAARTTTVHLPRPRARRRPGRGRVRQAPDRWARSTWACVRGAWWRQMPNCSRAASRSSARRVR